MPYTQLDPSCVWNADKNQTAIDALMKVPSSKNEVSGVIYQNEKGEYCYSLPIESETSDEFNLRVRSTPDLRFDSIYHTHPFSGDAKTNGLFSPEDVKIANQLKRDSFIRSMDGDIIKKYTPGVSKIDSRQKDNGKSSAGEDITPAKKLAAVIRNTPPGTQP